MIPFLAQPYIFIMYFSSCLSRFLCQVNHLLHNVEVICFMHLSPIANTKWWYKVKTDGVGQKTLIHSFSLLEPMVRLRILSMHRTWDKRLKKVQFWDIIFNWLQRLKSRRIFLREKFFRSGLLADVDDYDLKSTKKMEKI